MILPDWEEWPRVTIAGVTYAVAPRYVHGVGIGEAVRLAEEMSCILPSPAMVLAIWSAADCKLNPWRFARSDHDGTMATMGSDRMLLDQGERVERAIAVWENEHGRAKLVAGTHKDVVRGPDGRVGIYGWNRTEAETVKGRRYEVGDPIQGFNPNHLLSWRDYSQGLRLVKAVE